jgi:hypothetical protein
MFHWYQNATICYVYLVDVPSFLDSAEICDSIARSRWFTRGWTLQELLAPANIIFYSRDWKSLGTKSELLDVLSSITGIEEDFLQGKELQYASISKRMSWAAKRKTSRVEDIAYCLFGIFAVNMPLIYGEGKKSFQRLQHELIKTYPYDHTLYAWGVVVNSPSLTAPSTGELPSWNQSDARRRLLGALAISPRDFEFSGSFLPSPHAKDFYHDPTAGRSRLPIPLGLGVQFELPISWYYSAYHWSQVKTTQRRVSWVAILFCLFEKSSDLYVGIPLQSCGNSSWGRTSEIVTRNFRYSPSFFVSQIEMIHVEAEQPMLLENGDIIFRRLEFFDKFMPPSPFLNKFTHFTHGANVIREPTRGQCLCLYFQLKETGDNQLRGLGITFGRLSDETPLAGKLSVLVVPIRDSVAKNDLSVDHNGAMMVTEDFLREKWPEIGLDAAANESKYYHIMEPSADSWILDVEPLPKISIKAERLPVDLGREEGVVDVVDLVIAKRASTSTLPLIGKGTNERKGD